MPDESPVKEKETANAPAWGRWIPALTLISTFAIGAMQVATKSAADAAKDSADAAKLSADTALKERELGFRDREFRVKQDENVYKYVLDAIDQVHKDPKKVHLITLANILVNNMASQEYHGPYTLVLANFVTSNPASEKLQIDSKTVDDLTKKSGYLAAEKDLVLNRPAPSGATTAKPYGNWDIDVFWCETSPGSEKDARAAMEQLLTKGQGGRIRARLLPASINARAGYSVKGYEIRVDDQKAEQALAAVLKSDLDALLRASGAKETSGFVLRSSSKDTKWYLSAFYCPVSVGG